MATAKTLKDKIKELLEELVRAETLGEVQVDDLRVAIFDREFGKFPVAIVTPPSIESEIETNRENMRTYSFDILVVQKVENIDDDTNSIEDLAEAIMKKFDDDMLKDASSTLRAGGADGGVEPSTSSPEAITSRGKQYIAFGVTVRVRATYST